MRARDRVCFVLLVFTMIVCLGFAIYSDVASTNDQSKIRKEVSLALARVLSQARKNGKVPDQTGVENVAVNSNVVGCSLDKIDPGTILVAPSVKKMFSGVDDIDWQRYQRYNLWIVPCGLIYFNQNGLVDTYEHPIHRLKHDSYCELWPDLLTPEEDSPALRRY